MKKLASIASAILLTCTAFAQEALWGGASVTSPEINDDGTVTITSPETKEASES